MPNGKCHVKFLFYLTFPLEECADEFLSKILRDGVDTPSAVMTTRAPAVLKV